MMQPTHLKFGVLWCLAAIPLAVGFGLIPSLDDGYRSGDLILVLIGLYAAVKGALFGSEFPDTDHPTSIPSRKHPLLKNYFEFMRGVTGETGGGKGPKKKWYAHRGIVSHDYIVHLLRWGIWYVLVLMFGAYLQANIGTSKGLVILLYAIVIITIFSFANDLNNLFSYIEKKLGAQIIKNELIQRLAIYGCSLLIVIVLMYQNIGSVFTDLISFNISAETSSLLIMLFIYGAKIFIIFTCIGCFSHLFGDMITVSGVYFGTIAIKPMLIFMILTKIPGLNLAFDGFRTGGPWEKINNFIITILIIPATIISLYMVFGGDFNKIVEIFNVLKQ